MLVTVLVWGCIISAGILFASVSAIALWTLKELLCIIIEEQRHAKENKKQKRGRKWK